MIDAEQPDDAFQEVIELTSAIGARFSPRNNLQSELGLSSREMAKFWEVSCKFLKQKRFSEAADAFLFLATIDPQNVGYWLNLGMAEYGCNRPSLALKAFGMACIVDPDNPAPHVYAAECYMAKEDLNKAVDSLKLALVDDIDRQELTVIKKRAMDLTKVIKNFRS